VFDTLDGASPVEFPCIGGSETVYYERGTGFFRSDNGSELAAAARELLGRLGVKTLYIEPGSPRENGAIYRSFAHSTIMTFLLPGGSGTATATNPESAIRPAYFL